MKYTYITIKKDFLFSDPEKDISDRNLKGIPLAVETYLGDGRSEPQILAIYTDPEKPQWKWFIQIPISLVDPIEHP